ncbi:MAG TPA: MXAN_5187 C-terminal domain-containing protein [Geobacteraceae bacterium]
MGIAEDISAFERMLGDLVIKYEQYFLGMEKREPLQLLAEVEKASRVYQNVNIVNTMLKFKYNSTVARLNSYKQYWNRITRLIEEGKYSRDRFKMEMHLQGNKEKPKDTQRKSGTDENRIFQQYVEARRACNLPTDNITPEMIASVIDKQKPAIFEKYRCSDVEFKVVVEGGKPKIKARPKLSTTID